MTKAIIHELFRGHITTVRKNQVIICIGYVDAPENFKKYTKEEEEEITDICKECGFDFHIEEKKEYGLTIKRIRFEI